MIGFTNEIRTFYNLRKSVPPTMADPPEEYDERTGMKVSSLREIGRNLRQALTAGHATGTGRQRATRW
jgi:hypothetical protein